MEKLLLYRNILEKREYGASEEMLKIPECNIKLAPKSSTIGKWVETKKL